MEHPPGKRECGSCCTNVYTERRSLISCNLHAFAPGCSLSRELVAHFWRGEDVGSNPFGLRGSQLPQEKSGQPLSTGKKKKGMATSPPPANKMQLLTAFSSKLTMKNKNKQKKNQQSPSLSEHDPRPSVDLSCQWLLHTSYQVAPGRTESCSLPPATCPWSGTSVPW